MKINNIYDKGALISKHREYSLDEFNYGSEILAEISSENSIILVIDDKSIHSTLALISVIRSRRNLILIDFNNVSRQFKEVIDSFHPDVILSSNNAISKLGLNNEKENNLFSSISLKKNKAQEHIESDYGPIILLPTSGTSGPQKFVGLSHHNLKSNCNSIKEYLKIDQNIKCINNLPCSYSYGLSVLNTTLSAGGQFCCAEEPTIVRKTFWEDMKYFGITSFSGVPGIYQDLIQLNLLSLMPKSIQLLTQAGGKLSINLQKEILNWALIKKIKFFVMYGQTEATARLTYLELTAEPEKLGSVGRPIPNVNLISQFSSTGTQEKELIFKGENISLGYFRDKEDLKNIQNTNKGVLKTGDVGFIDSDGCIFITGRISRFAKIDGKRISLDQIENNLKETFPDLAVVSNDQLLFILINSNEANEIKNIKNSIKLISGIHPTKIKILSGVIPKSTNGKILYSKILIDYVES